MLGTLAVVLFAFAASLAVGHGYISLIGALVALAYVFGWAYLAISDG